MIGGTDVGEDSDAEYHIKQINQSLNIMPGSGFRISLWKRMDMWSTGGPPLNGLWSAIRLKQIRPAA